MNSTTLLLELVLVQRPDLTAWRTNPQFFTFLATQLVLNMDIILWILFHEALCCKIYPLYITSVQKSAQCQAPPQGVLWHISRGSRIKQDVCVSRPLEPHLLFEEEQQ